MKAKFILCISFVCVTLFSVAQEEKTDFYKNTSSGYNYRINIRTYFFFHGGCTFSAGFSNWLTYKNIQPAENISVNFILGKRNLGNRDKNYNRWQVNVISSTFVSFNIGNQKNQFYTELNPFYYGNCSGAYTNFKHAFTIGSSFVAMPKGAGKNVATPRNRSQQLLYIQLKSGSTLINLYEDYLIFTELAAFQYLADNRDRFYTGGGNLQVRINKNVKLKYYTEMYTGNSYMDRDDYPDLIIPPGSVDGVVKQRPLGTVGPKRALKFAYQDDGQREFNRGRNFLGIEINPNAYTSNLGNFNNAKFSNSSSDILIGLQDGQAEMWQQQLIHSLNKIDRDLKRESSTDKIKTDRLHFFEPPNHQVHWFKRIRIGLGTSSDFILPETE